MEKTEQGCIILKKSEYDALLSKANDNRQKEIKFRWVINKNQGDTCFNNNYSDYCSSGGYLDLSGDFQLSGKFYAQIHRILTEWTNKTETRCQENSLKYLRAFEELPLYKRIFFKASKGISQ